MNMIHHISNPFYIHQLSDIVFLSLFVTDLKNIYSEIISLFDGKCLDVLNNSNEDETNVQVYDCNGSDAQKWIYLPSTKEIKNINGKCLDLLYNDNSDGANIQIYHCICHIYITCPLTKPKICKYYISHFYLK